MACGIERNGRQNYFDERTTPWEFGKIRYGCMAGYVPHTYRSTVDSSIISKVLRMLHGIERNYKSGKAIQLPRPNT